jgi:hypothetical protein
LLTEECIRRARARGARAVGLHTTTFMAVARAMYERSGWDSSVCQSSTSGRSPGST